MSHVVACPIVLILWSGLAGINVQSYEKWSFFHIFSRLGPFPQVFRQAKEWHILVLHETISVSHVVACPLVFIYERSW